MFMAERIAAFERGKVRATNPEYGRLAGRIQKQRKRVTMLRAKDNVDEVKVAASLAKIQTLLPQKRSIPSRDAMDPGYRRLRYCRYADDFMIGVIGSKEDARSVFAEVRAFLTEALALTVRSEERRVGKECVRTCRSGWS